MKVLVFTFVTILAFSEAYEALNSTIVKTVKAAIMSDVYKGIDLKFVTQAIRLIFHDCVSTTCDGCINLSNEDNVGLDEVIDGLEVVYADYSTVMSRADFWVLAAIKAIEFTTKRANGADCDYGACPVINVPDITFQYGRVDCDTSPTTTEVFEFPTVKSNGTTMFTYFSDHFGYTEDEVVALMGAHTLGRNWIANSGFKGDFIEEQVFILDNKFYQDMVDTSVTWSNDYIKVTDKWQFGGTDTAGETVGVRLNTDLELVYDITFDESNWSSTCTIGTDCATANTYGTVATYANDADTWATDFVAIMNKLINRGYDNLSDLS